MGAPVANTVSKKIIPILRGQKVKKAAFFGSFARGQANKNSDIDLLIEFGGNKTLLDMIRLKLDIEKKLRRKVDVLTYDSIHPLLRNTILNEQKIFYEKRS